MAGGSQLEALMEPRQVPHYSPDGRFYWNGYEWRPVPPPPPVRISRMKGTWAALAALATVGLALGIAQAYEMAQTDRHMDVIYCDTFGSDDLDC